MAVNRINGQDLAALFANRAARTPAPHRRADEANENGAPPVGRPDSGNSEEQVQRAARSKQKAPQPVSSGVHMQVDKESKRIVAQILDDNNQVIKQIPPEEMLKIAARNRRIEGILFDQET